jgi:hypothetical protein
MIVKMDLGNLRLTETRFGILNIPSYRKLTGRSG